MTCPECGGSTIGDGYTVAYHCENVDLQPDLEPDSGPHYCDPTPDDPKEDPFLRDDLTWEEQCLPAPNSKTANLSGDPYE